MNKEKYQELIQELTPKENRLFNMFTSFFIGGLIGVISTILYIQFLKIYDSENAIGATLLVLILITAIITGLGFADSLFQKLQCGLIIPITGFAHSITSAIVDYKKEGWLAVGSNTFKLAGSVILYSVISSITLAIIKVVLHV